MPVSVCVLMCSVPEMAVCCPDRVISIQGTVDNMVAAQAAISLKLAECMERDMHTANGVSMFVALVTIVMVPTVMESHGILASHGKSWKMERVMEKSWNFNHLFSEKNS